MRAERRRRAGCPEPLTNNQVLSQQYWAACPCWEKDNAGHPAQYAAIAHTYGPNGGRSRDDAGQGRTSRGVRWGRGSSSLPHPHSTNLNRRWTSHWIEGFQPVLGCLGLTKPPSPCPSRTVWKTVPATPQGRKLAGTPFQGVRRGRGRSFVCRGRSSVPHHHSPDSKRRQASAWIEGFQPVAWVTRANQAVVTPPQPDRLENGPCLNRTVWKTVPAEPPVALWVFRSAHFHLTILKPVASSNNGMVSVVWDLM